MAFDKIGLHVIGDRVEPALLRKAPLVVLVDSSIEYAQRVRAAMRSDAWMVMRWFEKEQRLDNPEARAVDWFVKHREQIEALKGPRVVFQGYNEIGSAQAGAYALFEHRRAELLWSVGAGMGFGAFSVGEIHESLWPLFGDTLCAMDPQRDAVLLHEYWAEPFDIHNPWYCGRWRVPEVGAALAGQTVLVTETGRDVLWENNVRRGWPGWRRVPGLSDAGFLIEIDTYEQMIKPFPDVKGAALFSGGNTEYGWQNYDVNDLWPIIAEEQPEPVSVPDKLRLRSPLAVAYRVSSAFGMRDGEPHKGTDLVGKNGPWTTHGLAVYATHDGQALTVANRDGYGMYVYLKGQQCDTLYAHLADLCVSYGQQVTAGMLLGHVGYTGNTDPLGVNGAHLHFGVRPVPYRMVDDFRGYVDPALFIA